MELILKVVIGAIILLLVVLLWKPIGNITRSDLGSFFSSKKQLLLKIVVAAILIFLALFQIFQIHIKWYIYSPLFQITLNQNQSDPFASHLNHFAIDFQI